MADNKKYYYIKLKANYFEQDNIKVLEAMDNGYTYSLIIIKLYLKALKYNGKLMITSSIPYDPNKIDILAKVVGHDVAHVREAITAGVQLDLITILEGKEIWMNDIQNFIGQSSTEADRIREYRSEMKNCTNVQHLNDKSTPELRVQSSELRVNNNIVPTKKRKTFKKPTIEEVQTYCNERKNNLDGNKFLDYYESKGWKIGKNSMKDWKAAIRTWERNASNSSYSNNKQSNSNRLSKETYNDYLKDDPNAIF